MAESESAKSTAITSTTSSKRFWRAIPRLARGHDYVVIEGAGSVAELNLKHYDLVNLGLARRLDASSILVADIDRGGVFASVIGTLDLLDKNESSLVRSFLINRFRGDRAFFGDGVRILEEKAGRPCLGVFPFLRDVYLDDEDSVSLEENAARTLGVSGNGSGRECGRSTTSPYFQFHRISGECPMRCSSLIPWRKSLTLSFFPVPKIRLKTCGWLRARGLDRWLSGQMEQGSRIVGVCGGFQMMGKAIHDPEGLESGTGSARGLGFLPVTTKLVREKTTRTVRARTPSGLAFDAYEIHMGVTSIDEDGGEPFAVLEDGTRRWNPPSAGDRNIPPRCIREQGSDRGAFRTRTYRWSGRRESHPLRPVSRIWFAEYVEHDVFFTEYVRKGT